MNLEQVKEHFKYAKEVKCLDDNTIYDISTPNLTGITQFGNRFVVYDSERKQSAIICIGNQLAEILTYVFDRGEEVEVRDYETDEWEVKKFITFDLDNNPVVKVENKHSETSISYFQIRKLTPESLLEPQLSELKKTAEANGMSVEIIFKHK